MTAAQPSPSLCSASSFPICASTLRPAPAPIQSGRLGVIPGSRRSRPFVFILLQTLFRSCRSSCDSRPLFSIACALFDKNTGGGIPRQHFVSCAETQKCLCASPLPATLTHSLSRNSFPCHSYANTGDMGVTVASDFGYHQSTLDIRLSSPLCFHGLTNPFYRKPFRFTSIQNPVGVPLHDSQILGSLVRRTRDGLE